MKRFFVRFIDDILLLLGCICILYGLAMWNIVLTWVVAGLMLVIFSVLIGKVKARNDHQ